MHFRFTWGKPRFVGMIVKVWWGPEKKIDRWGAYVLKQYLMYRAVRRWLGGLVSAHLSHLVHTRIACTICTLSFEQGTVRDKCVIMPNAMKVCAEPPPPSMLHPAPCRCISTHLFSSKRKCALSLENAR